MSFDSVLSSICHRAGPHTDVLTLCERCSAVYAGILAGIVLEALLQGACSLRPGRKAVVLASAALATMAVVGFGGIYGLFQPPESVKVFAALWFGSAIAFFAVAALAKGAGRAEEPFTIRLVLPAGMGVLALLVAADSSWALWAVGAMAVPGLCAGLLLVNFAVAFSILGSMGQPLSPGQAPRKLGASNPEGRILHDHLRNTRIRVAGSTLLVPVFIAAEFFLFRLWRSIL